MNQLLERNARELGALNVAQMHARAAVASCRSTPYTLDPEAPPHIGMVEEAIGLLQSAIAAWDRKEPQWGKADGLLEEAGRLVREVQELPARGRA